MASNGILWYQEEQHTINYLSGKEGFVRILKSKSVLKLTPQKNGKLHADCFIEADPGGQIPVWVINMVSTSTPYETFKKSDPANGK